MTDPLVLALVQRRRAAGVSQATMAATLGVARECLSRIENGHISPRCSLVVRYARAVGAEVVVEALPGDGGTDGAVAL